MIKKDKQKLYCYVDETGQDTGSEFFVVVALVSDKEQEQLRGKLLEIESRVKIGNRKWHKTKLERNKDYLGLVLASKVGQGDIYFGRYKKPIPYFLPLFDVLERAIIDKAKKDYRAIIYVDGIDKKKSIELTNALRVRDIKLGLVRSRRDESEPLIRLVDRWAGCIRAAFLNKIVAKEIFEEASKIEYFKNIKKPSD